MNASKADIPPLHDMDAVRSRVQSALPHSRNLIAVVQASRHKEGEQDWARRRNSAPRTAKQPGMTRKTHGACPSGQKLDAGARLILIPSGMLAIISAIVVTLSGAKARIASANIISAIKQKLWISTSCALLKFGDELRGKA